jgi:hypothetical protein
VSTRRSERRSSSNTEGRAAVDDLAEAERVRAKQEACENGFVQHRDRRCEMVEISIFPGAFSCETSDFSDFSDDIFGSIS